MSGNISYDDKPKLNFSTIYYKWRGIIGKSVKGADHMKRLPIGIEDFKELIDKDCYYVDKTSFITDIINEKVALYTRPRRFGKTLNMSRRCPPMACLQNSSISQRIQK